MESTELRPKALRLLSVNWAFTTTIALSLSNPFNLGLAASTSSQQVQVEFNEVLQEELPGLTQVPGNPGDPVAEAIPDIFYRPDLDDYEPGIAGFTGQIPTGRNILNLTFTHDTTVAEANQLLRDLGAVIVGGLPGINGEIKGDLTVRVPTESMQKLIDLITSLKTHPNLAFVTPSVIIGNPFYELSPEEPEPEPEDTEDGDGANGGDISPQSITNPNHDPSGIHAPAAWSWELTPQGGNFGLEYARVPQLWNLNAALEERGAHVNTGVIDFILPVDHPDLIFEDLYPLTADPSDLEEFYSIKGVSHGLHVLSIIGAEYDNHNFSDAEHSSGIDRIKKVPAAQTSSLPDVPKSLPGAPGARLAGRGRRTGRRREDRLRRSRPER